MNVEVKDGGRQNLFKISFQEKKKSIVSGIGAQNG
jgi:hypothetical protein